MHVSLTSILMRLLAIRLSPQAGKSLVISRKRARRKTHRCATFLFLCKLMQRHDELIHIRLAMRGGQSEA